MKIICAYTVNLDAVYNVNALELARLSSDLKPENQEKITRLEDLLSALLFCMKEGSGDELPIEREEVAVIIERAFHWEYRLGGNAGSRGHFPGGQRYRLFGLPGLPAGVHRGLRAHREPGHQSRSGRPDSGSRPHATDPSG